MGTQFLHFQAPATWETSTDVHAEGFYSIGTPLLQSDRDLIADPAWADRVASNMKKRFGDSDALSSAHIQECSDISPMRPDSSFQIKIKAESETRCNHLADAYHQTINSYYFYQPANWPRRILIDFYPARSKSSLIEWLNPLIGVAGGLTIALLIFWFSNFDFKRRAIARTSTTPPPMKIAAQLPFCHCRLAAA